MGLTQTQLAEALQRDQSTVSKWERGILMPDFQAALKLAEISGLPVSRFSGGTESVDNLSLNHDLELQPAKKEHGFAGRVPYAGELRAGAWLEMDGIIEDLEEETEVPASPRYPSDLQYAYKVVGQSMNKIFPHGSWAHCVDVSCGRKLQDGDIVVVKRISEQDGKVEQTLKRVRLKGNKVELWPESTHPKFQRPIPLDNGNPDISAKVQAFVIGKYEEFT